MIQTPLRQRIHSLPSLFAKVSEPFTDTITHMFSTIQEKSFDHIYLVGCGDSYHACVGAVLAFQQLTGINTQAVSSLTFSRYTVGYLNQNNPSRELVIIVSVSGVVSRSIEATLLAQRTGATVITITGDNDSPLAHIAEHIFAVNLPSLKDEPGGAVVPGTRSFIGSQLALFYMAIYLGEKNETVTKKLAGVLRVELKHMGTAAQKAISSGESVAQDLVKHWQSPSEFLYIGAGPLYGTAMLSAAKMLESSGDSASAQETEEWTHLEYFIARQEVPTIFLSTGKRDFDRFQEAVRAAQAIGRRIAIVVPENDRTVTQIAEFVFPMSKTIRECFTPLVYCIPGMLIADIRGKLVGETYFRNFGRGRTVDWADGPSKLRDSHLIDSIPLDEITGRNSNLKSLQPLHTHSVSNEVSLFPEVEKKTAEYLLLPASDQQKKLLKLFLDTNFSPEKRLQTGNALAELGDPRSGVGIGENNLPDIDWVSIPAGRLQYQNKSTLSLLAFSISRYPITYSQFQAFLDASDGFTDPRWWKNLPLRHTVPGDQKWKIANHPRERVSWFDAIAFTRWLSHKSGTEVRLPTEEEWERTAKGGTKQAYPWGDNYLSGYANIDETRSFVGSSYLGQTTPVGMYPQGASEFGVYDLSGNVWEWCLNHYQEPTDLGLNSELPRVLKGGAYYYTHTDCNIRTRYLCDPGLRLRHRGFRVVLIDSH